MLNVADRLIDVRRDRRAGWACDDEHDLRIVSLSVRSGSCAACADGLVPANASSATGCACESDRAVGTVAQLRDLVASARRHDVHMSSTARRGFGRLIDRRVESDGAVLQLAELAAMYDAVCALTAALRSGQRLGVGLVDTSPTVARTGLLRCWPYGLTRPEVIRRGRVTVGIASESLDIAFGDGRPTIRDVRTFGLSAAGAVVTDADDVEHVLDDDAAEALCRLAPDSTGFRVRRVPEVLAWAELSSGLELALEDARNAGRGARVGFRSGAEPAASLIG